MHRHLLLGLLGATVLLGSGCASYRVVEAASWEVEPAYAPTYVVRTPSIVRERVIYRGGTTVWRWGDRHHRDRDHRRDHKRHDHTHRGADRGQGRR